jgi:hypothetical protein
MRCTLDAALLESSPHRAPPTPTGQPDLDAELMRLTRTGNIAPPSNAASSPTGRAFRYVVFGIRLDARLLLAQQHPTTPGRRCWKYADDRNIGWPTTVFADDARRRQLFTQSAAV